MATLSAPLNSVPTFFAPLNSVPTLGAPLNSVPTLGGALKIVSLLLVYVLDCGPSISGHVNNDRHVNSDLFMPSVVSPLNFVFPFNSRWNCVFDLRQLHTRNPYLKSQNSTNAFPLAFFFRPGTASKTQFLI